MAADIAARRLPVALVVPAPLSGPLSGPSVDRVSRAGMEATADDPSPATDRLFVGQTPIREADIAREMQFHRAARPQQSRAAAARSLVVRELLRQEAARLGLVARPAEGEPEEDATIAALLDTALPDRAPSAADCARYYAGNRDHFRSPDRLRVRHILLAAAPDDAAGRLRARDAGEQLIGELQQAPRRFTELAMRHSACPSREQGGELGWLQRGQTTPELERQLFRLRVGLAALPLESRWGYHVVSLDAVEPGQPLAFEQVHARIRDYLELQLRQRELQHYLQQLQVRHGVRGLEEIEAEAAQ